MPPPSMRFATSGEGALPLHLVDRGGRERWLAGLDAPGRAWVEAVGFAAGPGDAVILPGPDGAPAAAAAGLGTPGERTRRRFSLASARAALPGGIAFRLDLSALAEPLSPDEVAAEALGWLLAGYRFERYRSGASRETGDGATPPAGLLPPAGVDARRLEIIAGAEAMTRDLINTPAADLGPAELAESACALAAGFGCRARVIEGEALADGFPLIAAVGAASPRPPRLVELEWGRTGPRVTLVGKGVCFDTGGLDLKPARAMALMKKDMGGAATVLGLAQMVMALELPLRLRVLIPAVENAVGGAAFRPGDILHSRKGLTVEVNNTDAEGRLVLADALALASESEADLVVSMATLTGAARVALGPDLAPFYATDEALAAKLAEAGARVADPLWRLPFWSPYEEMIEARTADLDNAPSGGFAGSITAALFLRRFVRPDVPYLHFDIYGWQPRAAPARPVGGVGQGARALLEVLQAMATGA